MLNCFQQAMHEMLPKSTHDECSRQEFAKSLKGFVQQQLLPGLEPVYANQVSKQFAKEHGRAPADRHDIRKGMIKNPYFLLYASINRIAQELLWDSTLTSIDRELPVMIEKAETLSANAKAKLVIPEDFVPPRYVSALDIHCMPGGYCTEVAKNDIAAGALYDRGVYLYAMGYAGPYNDDMGRSVCNYIKRKYPDFKPRRILDMGCTVGHSTVPYKEYFPDAEVWGIDVGAPVVRYAHARSQAMGHDINFAQMNAEQTTFDDGYFDLVVSHILLHETSGKAMPRIFAECNRLLADGGMVIHADLPPFDLMDPFTQFILDNETWYNNEPFWGAMREADQIELSEKAGFDKEQVRFDTAPMAIMEFAAQQTGYDEHAAEEVADRDFTAGEFAPGGGWEVLVANKVSTSKHKQTPTSRERVTS